MKVASIHCDVLLLSQSGGDTKVIYFYASVLISSPGAFECYQPICIVSQFSPVWWGEKINWPQRHRGANAFRGLFRVFKPERCEIYDSRVHRRLKGNLFFWGAAGGDQTNSLMRSQVQGSGWFLTQLACILLTSGGDWSSALMQSP